jgi:hypothetical protein
LKKTRLSVPTEREFPKESSSFQLQSAYRTVQGKEPAFTTWKSRNRKQTLHAIDFVFYSVGCRDDETGLQISPRDILLMPEAVPRTMSKILALGAATTSSRHQQKDVPESAKVKNGEKVDYEEDDIPTPNWHYPSDHFSVVVDFTVSYSRA